MKARPGRLGSGPPRTALPARGRGRPKRKAHAELARAATTDPELRGEEAAAEASQRTAPRVEPSPEELFAVMVTSAPSVSVERAETLARRYWGIVGRAEPLGGERDRNFRLVADDGRAYVLRFANPAEDPAVTELQIRALRHVAQRDPQFPVPRVVPLSDGGLEARVVDAAAPGPELRARLLTWLPGRLLEDSPRSPRQRRALGRALGRLDRTLRDFAHRAGRHPLIWDIAYAARLRLLLENVDKAVAARVSEALDGFEARVVPALLEVRRQIVHNDLSPSNTLVDERDPDRFAGLIDFGDMVETALVADVAVGATAQFADGVDTVVASCEFVAGFHEVVPLTPTEVDLLPDLIAARICLDLVLPAWHRRRHPDNPRFRRGSDTEADYAPEIARQLRWLEAVRTPEAAGALRATCLPREPGEPAS